MSDDASIPKKSLGQHWLHDESSLEAMCLAADIKDDDVILEIGPGLGTLTKKLTEQAKEVVAVEFDTVLAAELSARVKASNLQVIESDILKFDFSRMPPEYKLVANIPYYLTSNLIRTISEVPNPPSVAAILVQKEVAERVAAAPGQMSILAVTAQYFWEVSLGRTVEAGLFTPPPKVDSQILILKRRPSPLFPGVDSAKFFRVVKAGFSQKRKTLQNSISGGLGISKDQAKSMLQSAGIDPAARAQTLSLNDWHRLSQAQI